MSASPEPATSIVVVNHNEGALLRMTVENMLATTPGDTEIVVVDDQSDDGSTEDTILAHPRVRLLRGERPLGISAARNLGGRAARGRVVVFSDAHCAGRGDWLPPILDALADPTVGEVAPGIGYLDERHGIGYGFTWTTPNIRMSWLRRSGDDPTDVPFLCGCFLAMRREVFDEVGGFDEGMYRWGFEDSELSLRLWLHGYRVQVVPTSVVDHQFRDKFPYEVDHAGIAYNALRLITVHGDETAAARVLAHYGARPTFPRAWQRLIDSDTHRRRRDEQRVQTQPLRPLLDRFGIDVLG